MQKLKKKIIKELEELLHRAHELDESEIIIEFDGDIIVLKGIVPSYHAKNVAERLIKSINGIYLIKNDLFIKVPLTFKIPRKMKF